jgi:iron(III) transport system substrate-binding protein
MRLLALALVIATFAAACGSSDTPEPLEGVAADIYSGDCSELDGRQVTIYSGRSENLMDPVLSAFECETGIETAVRYDSATNLALTLAEEGDRTSADVFLSNSPGPIGFLDQRNLLGEIEPDVLALVDDQNRSGDGRWVGFSGRKRVAVYNIDSVSVDELPESVFELTDQEWRDRVAIPGTNGSFLDWFTVFRAQEGDAVATQWLNDMVANGAKFYANNRSIVDAVGRGEIDLGLVNHYYNYQEAAAIGEDHRALNHDLAGDDIGSLLIITAATVVENADNSAEAHELIRYLLSEPVQRYYTEETFEYPLAAGVQPADILPPLNASGTATIDFDSLGGGLEASLEIIEASGIANQ